ncbi:MAG TPA: hypothetical protein VHF24_06140 [Acidimicrobiales bacterium]|nr:hypothetical protein [Acidimicrobiales bacterium]
MRRPRSWVAGVVVLSLMGLTSCADGDRALPRTRCRGHVGAAHVVARGSEFGGWRLIAYDGWENREYALMFDHPAVNWGCGTVGRENASLAHGGGSGETDRGPLRYVLGAVLPPVESVTLIFQGGNVVDPPLGGAPGMRHRFFGAMAEGTGSWVVLGKDASGKVVARA